MGPGLLQGDWEQRTPDAEGESCCQKMRLCNLQVHIPESTEICLRERVKEMGNSGPGFGL